MKDQGYLNGEAIRGPSGPMVAGPQDRDAMADGIARWVVRLLAARRTVASTLPQPALVARLRAAVHSDSPGAVRALLRAALREKIGADELADLYIPAVARDLGADWLDDRLCFADVHAACARLQSMLRIAGQAWSADAAERPAGGGAVLLLVPPGESHTLGAMVLMGQLRRLGISVCLTLWPGRGEIAAQAGRVRPNAVFVSSAEARQLAPVRKFVNDIRAVVARDTPVLLGGAAVLQGADMCRGTGVDLATTDLAEALRFSGLGPARVSGPAGFSARAEGVK